LQSKAGETECPISEDIKDRKRRFMGSFWKKRTNLKNHKKIARIKGLQLKNQL
jgi:hypothetical protein